MSIIAFSISTPLSLPHATPPPLCPLRRHTPLAKSIQPDSTPDLTPFSTAVRGEWTGYEGLFNAQTGTSVAIPDYYVPEQFSDWNVTPHGFECNHSVIVRDTKLYRKFFRIIPCVSQFGDHVDAEEELLCDELTQSGVSTFDDGAFIICDNPVLTRMESKLDKLPVIQFYLRDPLADARRGLRVSFAFDFESAEARGEMRVVLEEWACVYCDGANMEGSSGYVEGWVMGERCNWNSLKGMWRTDEGENVDRTNEKILKEMDSLVYLPGGIDVSVGKLKDDGLVLQTGWLVNEDTRMILRRRLGCDGTIQNSERIVERRVKK